MGGSGFRALGIEAWSLGLGFSFQGLGVQGLGVVKNLGLRVSGSVLCMGYMEMTKGYGGVRVEGLEFCVEGFSKQVAAQTLQLLGVFSACF